jgi:hypothetical protein
MKKQSPSFSRRESLKKLFSFFATSQISIGFAFAFLRTLLGSEKAVAGVAPNVFRHRKSRFLAVSSGGRAAFSLDAGSTWRGSTLPKVG